MPDLGSLTAAQEAQKRATLEALAQYGSAGVAAYQQAQQQLHSSQSQALGAIAQGAQGAPAGATEYLQSIARGPGDNFSQAMTAAEATLSADMNRMSAAHTAYYDQAQAAVPLLQTEYDGRIAFARELAELDRQRREQEAAAAAAANQGRYGGYNTAGEYENAVMALARQAQLVAGQQALSSAKEMSPKVGWGKAGPSQSTRGQAADSARYEGQAAQFAQQQIDARYAGPARDRSPGEAPTAALFAERDRAQAAYQEQIARSEQAAQAEQQRAQQAAQARAEWDRQRQQFVQQVIGPMQQVRSPLNLHEFARDVAINQLGADPLDAQGRFSPEWSMAQATSQMNAPLDYQAALNEQIERETYGGFTRSEYASMTPTDATTKERMDAANVSSPDDLAAIEGSAEYQAAIEEIESRLAAMTQGGDSVTIDLVRYLLLRYPPAVADLVLYEYSGRLPSVNFRPPEG